MSKNGRMCKASCIERLPFLYCYQWHNLATVEHKLPQEACYDVDYPNLSICHPHVGLVASSSQRQSGDITLCVGAAQCHDKYKHALTATWEAMIASEPHVSSSATDVTGPVCPLISRDTSRSKSFGPAPGVPLQTLKPPLCRVRHHVS